MPISAILEHMDRVHSEIYTDIYAQLSQLAEKPVSTTYHKPKYDKLRPGHHNRSDNRSANRHYSRYNKPNNGSCGSANSSHRKPNNHYLYNSPHNHNSPHSYKSNNAPRYKPSNFSMYDITNSHTNQSKVRFYELPRRISDAMYSQYLETNIEPSPQELQISDKDLAINTGAPLSAPDIYPAPPTAMVSALEQQLNHKNSVILTLSRQLSDANREIQELRAQIDMLLAGDDVDGAVVDA